MMSLKSEALRGLKKLFFKRLGEAGVGDRNFPENVPRGWHI